MFSQFIVELLYSVVYGATTLVELRTQSKSERVSRVSNTNSSKQNHLGAESLTLPTASSSVGAGGCSFARPNSLLISRGSFGSHSFCYKKKTKKHEVLD